MEWKDIKGYEGIYKVSNEGQVKSIARNNKFNNRNTEIIMKLNAYGANLNYRQISLHKDGKRKNGKIHRLVAEAFIPNPNNLRCVMHMDDNPTNNHVSNLQWGTHKMNLQQMSIKGRWSNQYK
jgi:hypothetical protein